jgi:hypothetical protein
MKTFGMGCFERARASKSAEKMCRKDTRSERARLFNRADRLLLANSSREAAE